MVIIGCLSDSWGILDGSLTSFPPPPAVGLVELGKDRAVLPHRGCDVIPVRCSLAWWELFARVGGTPGGDFLAWKVLGMNHLSWAWCHKQEHIVATLLIPGMLCPDLNLYSILSLFKYIYIYLSMYVCVMGHVFIVYFQKKFKVPRSLILIKSLLGNR